MKVVFYGSRGSYSTSTSPKRIEEIAKFTFSLIKKNPKANWTKIKKLFSELDFGLSSSFSQHTTCVELRSASAPFPIFLDLGTGLSAASCDKKSGINNKSFQKQKGEVAFFLSHTHWDHIIALPTLNHIYKGENKFHFYGCHPNLERRVSKLFDRDFFPVPYSFVSPRFQFHTVKKHDVFKIGDLRVAAAPQSHPGTSYVYRFEENTKSFVFATDTDLANTFRTNYPKDFNIYSSADLLALDAHYTHEDFVKAQDYGHPSIDMGVDFAVRHKVKHLILVHHNPNYSDQKLNQVLKGAYKYLYKKHGQRHPLKISLPFEGKIYTL
jgi:phosphoribosyl 1,2-cyclic phosphodiesterase